MMPNEYQQLIKTKILSHDNFISLSFSGAQKGQSLPWQKVTVRPILIKERLHLQFSYFDGRQDISKNHPVEESQVKLDELLALPFKSINLLSQTENIRVQFSKKGKAIIHRDKVSAAEAPAVNLSHNRQKNLILPLDTPDPFLQAIGIMTHDGKIKAKMRPKFWQINRFLQLIDQTKGISELSGNPLRVIDCGCGNAYLTFAVYHYLSHILGRKVELTGLDVRAGLIQKQTRQAQQLGWDGLRFETSPIINYQPSAPPDIVLALHACDTATDEALAQAIQWESKFIFSVPCCHHHLQAQLADVKRVGNPAYTPILRHGILKERLGDILTDTFRALILRILGYRTDVVEFIDSEHTAKNLMIRAVKTAPSEEEHFIKEYQALKEAWQVTPYLETLLDVPGSRFKVKHNPKPQT